MFNEAGAVVGGNRCMSKVTLAAGTTSTLSSTGTITFTINGKAYTKSAMSNAATPTTDAATGAAFPPLKTPASAAVAKQMVIVICLDASGALKACQGAQVLAVDVTNGVAAMPLPIIPDSLCPIGYITVVGSGTQAADWTFGTSNLSSVTGVTFTFTDLSTMLAAPPVA